MLAFLTTGENLAGASDLVIMKAITRTEGLTYHL